MTSNVPRRLEAPDTFSSSNGRRHLELIVAAVPRLLDGTPIDPVETMKAE